MATPNQIRRVIAAVRREGGRLGAVRCSELQLRKTWVEDAVARRLVDFDELTEDLVYPPAEKPAGYDQP